MLQILAQLFKPVLGKYEYELVSFVGRIPWLFNAYYSKHRRYADALVRMDTDLVIEGFPRCANSFAVFAFERAQNRSFVIGHHLHAPAQIILGVRYGLPILILIREPVAAAASLITRRPTISATQALKQYVRYYQVVQDQLDHLVLTDFETVTTDFDRAIGELNDRFGTKFESYRNSEEEDKAIFGVIDGRNEGDESGQINKLARPSELKKELLETARNRILINTHLPQAKLMYETLVTHSI